MDQFPDSWANRVEFRIAAMQRSGQHGIVHWIAAHFDGRVIFLNDAAPNSNPFFTCTSALAMGDNRGVEIAKNAFDLYSPRDCLICNYEDRNLGDVFPDEFEECHDQFVGPSGRRLDVLILRDPFNLFASRINASWIRHRWNHEAGRRQTVSLWKEYAREFLTPASRTGHERLLINYNRWHCDEGYRKSISRQMSVPFTDCGLNFVDPRFGGSSFDPINCRGNQMKVLERWKNFRADPIYRRTLGDDELLDLSDCIFGQIPGTDEMTAITNEAGFLGVVSES